MLLQWLRGEKAARCHWRCGDELFLVYENCYTLLDAFCGRPNAYDNLSGGKLLAVNGVAEMSFPLMKNATLFTMRFGVAPHAYDNLPAGKLLVVNGVAEMSFPLMKNATLFTMRFGVALHAYDNLPAGICSPSLALRICALALGKLLSHYFGFFFGGALSARGYRSHTLAVLLLRGSCSLFLALRIVICGGEVAPGTL